MKKPIHKKIAATLTIVLILSCTVIANIVYANANTNLKSATAEPAIGYDGYFQGGWANGQPKAGAGTINMNGLSGEKGLTAGTGPGNGDRIHFGTAGTVADGGKTTKGWRVLGVGSIQSVTLGSGNYTSQSTEVPENGAYILAEDQNGVAAQFGASKNYFDYASGSKNTIATTSENFVKDQGNFSTTEQDSLVSQQLTGVCNSSNGCSSYSGTGTSINSYKLYPPSFGDFYSGDGGPAPSGKFTSSMPVESRNPERYWLRSNSYYSANVAMSVTALSGYWFGPATNLSHGFRPAGILDLNKVLLTEKLVAIPAIGGEVATSRYTDAAIDGKKLVLQDTEIDKGELQFNGQVLDSNSTVIASEDISASITKVGGDASAKLAYKIVSRGYEGDGDAGTIIAAGEGSENSVNIESKYNFWNSDLAGNLPENHYYDLYLWAQVDNNNKSDAGSEPLKATLFSYATPDTTVLAVSRGGTGKNTAYKAAKNLGLVAQISKDSTASQFPTARAVYQNPTTTLITGYFKAIKYTNSGFVKMQIFDLAAGAATWNTTLGTLPEEYRPKNQAVYGYLLTTAANTAFKAHFAVQTNGQYSISSSTSNVATRGTTIIYSTKIGG
ncbi:MAG: hypothetical protein LBB10_02775 [Bifidobacteriaceae bacterium]|jgi:hypothetical protein|nr:hypothetical protein [Bifidobacteriaceae bacterium]